LFELSFMMLYNYLDKKVLAPTFSWSNTSSNRAAWRSP
jgi:hypothetical protein